MSTTWRTPAVLFTALVLTTILTIASFAGERVVYSFTGGIEITAD